MENKTAEEIIKKHVSELFGREVEPVDGLIIDVKTVKKILTEYTSIKLAEKDKEIERYKKSISDFALAISKLNNAKSSDVLEKIVIDFFYKIDKILSK